jgi:flagellar hook-associated protein 1 FlgK
MSSDFFGLQVGLSALNASRRAMEVAAQNVANANNEGYSRQRVNISSGGAPVTAAVFSRSDGSGSTVSIDSVTRMRDDFLEARALAEHSNQSSLTRSQTLLDRIELTFKEPSDTGLQSQIADLWAGFEDLANNPGSDATRSQLLQRANTIATTVNQAAKQLDDLWNSSVSQLSTIAASANQVADRVAELNGAIKRATAAGLNPNDLLDQRDKLVVQLSETVGATAQAGQLGTVNVFVGGTAIVRDEVANHLAINVPGGTNISTASSQPVQLVWVKDGFPALVTGGEGGGLLDGVNRMLPGYSDALIGSAPPFNTTSAVLTGQPVAAAGLKVDFSAAAISFQVAVDGGAAQTVTLNTDLHLANSAADVAVALNAAFKTAGVKATVTPGGAVAGPWTFSITGDSAGPTSSIAVVAGPAATTVFGAAPTSVAGTGLPGGTPSVAYQLAKVVNLQHQLGVDKGGSDGGALFAFSVAAGLSVLITDPTKVAAGSPTAGALDGSNALGLADISAMTGGPDALYQKLVIGLGVEAQTVNRRVDIQNDITSQVDSAREGASGVSIDEEMAAMVQFQHTYQAASRMITAIDDMLDRLINGTGHVGR